MSEPMTPPASGETPLGAAAPEAGATPTTPERNWRVNITAENARNVALGLVAITSFNLSNSFMGWAGEVNERADKTNTLVAAALLSDDVNTLKTSGRELLGLSAKDMAAVTHEFNGIVVLQPTDTDVNGDGIVDGDDLVEVYRGDGEWYEEVSVISRESARSAIQSKKSNWNSRFNLGPISLRNKWIRWPLATLTSVATTIGFHLGGRRVRQMLPENFTLPGTGGE